MTGVDIIPLAGKGPDGGERFRVVCDLHELDRTVDSQRHATNLEAKHLREDHAQDPELNITSLARWVVIVHDNDGPGRHHVLHAWQELTGLLWDEAEALDYARAVVARPLITYAHVSPL